MFISSIAPFLFIALQAAGQHVPDKSSGGVVAPGTFIDGKKSEVLDASYDRKLDSAYMTVERRTAAGDTRLVLIGFDGADLRIIRKLLDEKQLPNFQKLSETGSFYPLKTTNPAQSPVSWAAFNTGMGPDTTNIYDFVCRECENRETGVKLLKPTPANSMAFRVDEDADLYLPILLRSNYRIPLVAAVGFSLFILFFALFKFGAKFPLLAAAILSFVLGGVGGGAAVAMLRYLPKKLPVAKAERRGTPFWKYLDDSGVNSVGLSIPMVFPFAPEPMPHTKILGGLGIPDARQSPGDWWLMSDSKERLEYLTKVGQMAGLPLLLERQIERDRDGMKAYKATVEGPENFWLVGMLRDEIADIAKTKSTGPGVDKIRALSKREDEINSILQHPHAEVLLEARVSEDGRRVAIELDHKPILKQDGSELAVGDWSPLTRVTFQFNPILKLSTVARFRVLSVNPFEIYLKPLNLDPKAPPITAPISTPREFSAELANDREIMDFESLGWACATNALKDQAIDDTTFLQDIEKILQQRERLLYGRLSKGDWRFMYMVFGETDRVAHLMFRYYDEQHPLYKKEDAEKQVTFFGKSMALKDTVPEIYRQADRIVGEVLKRTADGKTQLIVTSDHGFSSFRQQVHTNSWLCKNGYLAVREMTDQEKEDLKDGHMSIQDFKEPKRVFAWVDWSKTRAYSLGLGKIYINVKGREPKGIVEPAEQEKLEREIAKKLEADVDPGTGKPFIKQAYLAREIYPERGKNLGKGERDNSEDIVIGFNEGYRVSWDSSLGGIRLALSDNKELFIDKFIEPNLEKWSGDHCSIDPSIVTGIFFSSMKLQLPADAPIPSVQHCAPTILQYFGVPIPQGLKAPLMPAK
ncbi:MAG: alkaline phosphatase family protein [Planctomycetes bacterium]|nr:alkaline phosphatase family protein [Planctomycetota bacterium]